MILYHWCDFFFTIFSTLHLKLGRLLKELEKFEYCLDDSVISGKGQGMDIKKVNLVIEERQDIGLKDSV
jgi:hypothetical protein